MNKWFFLIVIFDFGGSGVCWSNEERKKKEVKIKL